MTYYVKYDYSNGGYHITKIEANSTEELLNKLPIYSRVNNYIYSLITEEEYENYCRESIEKWTVKKKKVN